MNVISGISVTDDLESVIGDCDVIIDFSKAPLGTSTYYLTNEGPDSPFGGLAVEPSDIANPLATGVIMRFDLVAAVGADTSADPSVVGELVLPAITNLPAPAVTRKLSLNENHSHILHDVGPEGAKLGMVTFDPNSGMPMGMGMEWMHAVTERVTMGDTEVWELYNFTMDAHPIHVHEVLFQVVNREVFDPMMTGYGVPRAPEAWESGFKDTVISYPGEITRIKARFDLPGRYVWHCHIVEHEDNEMMRPYYIDPVGGFARTGVLDSFTRRNGALASTWVGERSRFTILNNQARVLLDGSVRWNTVFSANQEAFFRFSIVSPTATIQALLLKFNGASQYDANASFIEVAYQHQLNRVEVFTKDINLSYVSRAIFTGVTFASGDVFGARAVADGTVAVYKNGIPLGSCNLYAGPKPWSPTFVEGGGRIGVWFFEQKAADSGFDDFGGGTMF
ncbi:MAG: multicopper oxidase domain-containing protein [Anaerolineales bacterium]|nr:multicopper oxidase domain-containing protein [Anaerolineales bacterium]